MHKRLKIVLVAVLLGSIAGIWLLLPREHGGAWQEERIWRGWSGARKQPYALATDMLARHNIILHLHRRGEAFPGGHDALLLEYTALSDEERQAVRNWVNAGGRLILPARHPLAADFGIHWKTDAIDTDSPLHWPSRGGITLHPHTLLAAEIDMADGKRVLRAGTNGDGRRFAVEISAGRGSVIALGVYFELWRNTSFLKPGDVVVEGWPGVPLAEGDNAAFLHDVLSGKQSALLIPHHPPAPAYARPDATWWPLYAALLLFALAFVWHYGRRFGPLLPAADDGARDIEHHLQAAGDYWAQDEGGYGHIASRVRDHIRAQLQQRRHHYPDEAAMLADIAQQSGLPLPALNAALQDTPVRDEAAFVQFMIHIEHIRSVL